MVPSRQTATQGFNAITTFLNLTDEVWANCTACEFWQERAHLSSIQSHLGKCENDSRESFQ
jgi:hypothetical protein